MKQISLRIFKARLGSDETPVILALEVSPCSVVINPRSNIRYHYIFPKRIAVSPYPYVIDAITCRITNIRSSGRSRLRGVSVGTTSSADVLVGTGVEVFDELRSTLTTGFTGSGSGSDNSKNSSPTAPLQRRHRPRFSCVRQSHSDLPFMFAAISGCPRGWRIPLTPHPCPAGDHGMGKSWQSFPQHGNHGSKPPPSHSHHHSEHPPVIPSTARNL